jgi:ABC-2 type transport system permease protein
MLQLLTQSITNASFGIYFPRFAGTIYEILSAPVSPFEVVIGYVGAAAMKSLIIAGIIMLTAMLFVDYSIAHPFYAVGYIVLVASAFALFGFILGLWADGFEKLQIVPLLILTPLTFLGGTFYSIRMLEEPWRTVAQFNPIFYLISGLRWTFMGGADVPIGVSLACTLGFVALCIGVIAFIFRTGWRLRE